jgi:transmembrane sensor
MDVSFVTLDADHDRPLTAEALRWVALVGGPDATESDARMAAAWRSQGPAHDAAFREAVAFQRLIRAGALRPPVDNVTSISRRAATRGVSRRAAIFGGGAIAAGFAGVMAVRPPLGLWPSLADLTADHHTGIGERHGFTLASGAMVELSGRTAASLADQGRSLRLIEGEAFVRVDADRPVRLYAGDIALAIRSGAVNLRTSGRETCATCLTGTLIANGNRPVTLAEGQSLTLRPGRVAAIGSVDPTLADSWRRGLLIFQDTPLGEAVEAINRYRDGRVILASETLAQRPVDGVYHTNDLKGVVAQLQGLLHVQVTDLPGNVAVLA